MPGQHGVKPVVSQPPLSGIPQIVRLGRQEIPWAPAWLALSVSTIGVAHRGRHRFLQETPAIVFVPIRHEAPFPRGAGAYSQPGEKGQMGP